MAATYAYFPVFRRVSPAGLEDIDAAEAAHEWDLVHKEHADRVAVRGTYVAEGFRPGAHVMAWWIAQSLDDLQAMLIDFRRTRIGRSLELTWAFTGVHRPPEFNPSHVPAFMAGKDPKRYLCVYPFVRTPDWYLLPPDERAAMLREHGEMGREFPDVLPNTTSAFGLGDWEWILAFEADQAHRLVDCIRRLRDARARRFTGEEVPFVLGIRKEPAEVVADLR
ncbi:MAG: chlorite dismutase family protein [Actinomycetota bacterium]|nr:chlorite dismutase family protein [Actinomycetota bacterium]